MEKIVIFGGSGLIGTYLINELKQKYDIVIVSRKSRYLREIYKDLTIIRLRSTDHSKIVEQFEGAKAVINLAGEPVSGRWTKDKIRAIKKSRIDIDTIIVRSFFAAKQKPKTVIQGSAIGIYGYSRSDKNIDEKSKLGKHGFLPKVTAAHEEMFKQIEKFTRVVYLRTGIVLEKEKGALSLMAKPVKHYFGSILGTGKQWISWIHIKDEVRAIRYLIENDSCTGPYNLTAPKPVTNKVFIKTLSKILKRPCFLHIPGFALKLIMGKMADELILKGLKVLPAKLENDGFVFEFKELNSALTDIYKK